MKFKIGILHKQNPYDTFLYFSSKLGEAFQRHGVEVELIDIDNIAEEKRFINCLAQPDSYQLICSFNRMFIKADKPFWDIYKIPYLFMSLDPIIWASEWLKGKYEYVSCVDYGECEFAKTYHYPENIFFLPHGTDKEIKVETQVHRPYDVVFCGSCYDHETVVKKIDKNLDLSKKRIVLDAIQLFLATPQISIYQAIRTVLNDHKVNFQLVEISQIHLYVDSYIRGKDRFELIRSIKDATIHVYGGTAFDGDKDLPIKGWNLLLRDCPNVVVHPTISFKESLTVMQQAKIVLNSMSFFRNGSHERIFNALASGALPITTENIWVRKNFSDDEVVFYDPNHLEILNEKINDLLENETKRLKMVEKGRQNVMENHTWDVRAKQIIEYFKGIK